jgi:hypothetical protein
LFSAALRYDAGMRILLIAFAIGLFGCKQKPAAPPPPEPNRNPYHDVMPDKVKQKVEDTQKKEDERNDKVLENAK